MKDLDFQDQIDAYLLGRMSDSERAAFERVIAREADKREQYIFTRDLKDAISSREEKRREYRRLNMRYEMDRRRRNASIKDKIIREAKRQACYCCEMPELFAEPSADTPRRSSRRILKWAASIAAVLVLGVFGLTFMFSPHASMPSSGDGYDDPSYNLDFGIMKSPIDKSSDIEEVIECEVMADSMDVSDPLLYIDDEDQEPISPRNRLTDPSAGGAD